MQNSIFHQKLESSVGTIFRWKMRGRNEIGEVSHLKIVGETLLTYEETYEYHF